MATSNSEWALKLKGFLPSWFFETEKYQRAHFLALGKILSSAQSAMEGTVGSTYIAQAEESELDLHGSERSTARIEDELDLPYSERVRVIKNSSNKPAIKALVDSILDIGTCEIREGTGAENPYANRESFLNRQENFNEFHYNTFTIMIDRQVYAEIAALSRESFLNRSSFFSTSPVGAEVYTALQHVVDEAKAFGVFYKVVERR